MNSRGFPCYWCSHTAAVLYLQISFFFFKAIQDSGHLLHRIQTPGTPWGCGGSSCSERFKSIRILALTTAAVVMVSIWIFITLNRLILLADETGEGESPDSPLLPWLVQHLKLCSFQRFDGEAVLCDWGMFR